MANDLIIGMAGAGGDGIVSAGESLITASALDGYHAMMTKSFGPQIRGGESSFRIRVSTNPVYNPGNTLDVAVALNWDDFLKFGDELPVTEDTIVIYDTKTGIEPADIPLSVKPKQVLAVPIGEMAVEHAGTARAKNTIVLGLVSGWFGIAREGILAGIRKKFTRKGPEVLKGNEDAFAAGLKFAEENPLADSNKVIDPPPQNAPKKLLTDGNEIFAAGAVFSGCSFFSGYPITPSSEIMHFFNREVWKYDGSMLQMEDEIAGIGAALGASFAGKKALTATSGPGMALKSEILGLASISELPLVAVDVQRGGPSTGIPTKSEQSDLFQASFSAHGDVVRPVLAPISVGDSFSLSIEAFNIAEVYQTPVIVLSDQDISQRKETVDYIDTSQFTVLNRKLPTDADLEDYTRFQFTDDGVSPISHPGMEKGNYLASGIEHNEQGSPTSSGVLHSKMNEKRIHKLDPLKKRADLFLDKGDKDAEIGMISWGSIAGVTIEALETLQSQGLKVRLLIPRLLYPIAEEVYADFFKTVKKGFVIEQSHQGQLYRLIRMFTDVPGGVKSYCKSGSNPIIPSEVIKAVGGLK